MNLEVVHFKKSSYFRYHLVGNLVVEATIFYRALLLFVRTTDARITIYAPYQLIATKQYETLYQPLVESLLIHASFLLREPAQYAYNVLLLDLATHIPIYVSLLHSYASISEFMDEVVDFKHYMHLLITCLKFRRTVV